MNQFHIPSLYNRSYFFNSNQLNEILKKNQNE
jgi:hypothetical protein